MWGLLETEGGKFNLFYCLHVSVTSRITCMMENCNIKLAEVKRGLKAHSRPGDDGNAQICPAIVEAEELFCNALLPA